MLAPEGNLASGREEEGSDDCLAFVRRHITGLREVSKQPRRNGMCEQAPPTQVCFLDQTHGIPLFLCVYRALIEWGGEGKVASTGVNTWHRESSVLPKFTQMAYNCHNWHFRSINCQKVDGKIFGFFWRHSVGVEKMSVARGSPDTPLHETKGDARLSESLLPWLKNQWRFVPCSSPSRCVLLLVSNRFFVSNVVVVKRNNFESQNFCLK